jgi:hypothetical protein
MMFMLLLLFVVVNQPSVARCSGRDMNRAERGKCWMMGISRTERSVVRQR